MSLGPLNPRLTQAHFLSAAVIALVLGGSGCSGDGGTTGYDNPVSTTLAPPIINAQTLIAWADEGKINAPFGVADRVVVVSVTNRANFTSPTKKHIPDSVLLDFSAELSMTREEGLGPSGTMMLAGPQMDALAKRLGIDEHTTIVLTVPKATSDSEMYQMSVAYWTFRYWGFARSRVKILNGGDDAWEVAGQALTDAIVSVPPSSYNLTGNKTVKSAVRYSVGEMLSLVDSLNQNPAQRAGVQMLDVRGFATSPYIANTFRGTSGYQFVLDRVNGEAGRNRLYPSRETLLARMASLPVLDGATNTFLSPTRKTVVMCGSSVSASPTFVLFDAVLEVPEGDIAMYDGSSSQWNNYSFAKIRAAGATEAQANAWAFDVLTPGTALFRSVGTLPAPVAGENPFLPGNFIYPPSQTEVNQIEVDDSKFISATGGGTTPTTPSGPKPPGSGC
ncbi:MAG TPA: selenite/tellurite reduction operon rhodanese-like protein ExtH [Vicinamibacteria bacterium]|nr:selenite/tellurite reduction operon rhodanese-like protein ExtH [Vicinamibacteria bacterium]